MDTNKRLWTVSLSFVAACQTVELGAFTSEAQASHAGLNHLWRWPDITLMFKACMQCAALCSVLLFV